MKRRNARLVLLALAIILSAGICRAESGDTLKIGGTGFGLEQMRILARTYRQSHPETKVTVYPSLGSSGGIKALLAGALDLAIGSRPLRTAEKEHGLGEKELFKTPFVFIANSSVAKDAITTRELEQIYKGRETSWADGSRIRVVLRPKTETDTEIIMGLSPGMSEAVTAAMSRPGMILAVTDQENLATIEKTPGALGAGTLTQISTENRQVKILKLNGLVPNVAALRDGSYPMSKTLYLFTGTKMTAAARQFVDFLGTEQAEKILAEHGNLVATDPRAGS